MTLRPFIWIVLLVVALVGCSSQTTPTTVPTSTITLEPTLTFTPGPVELSATVFILQSTRTAIAIATNPALAPTPISAAPMSAQTCSPGTVNSFDGTLSARIQEAIDTTEVKDAIAGVSTTEHTDDCVTTTIRATQVSVDVQVGDLANDTLLNGHVEKLIAAMAPFPASTFQGTVTLVLRFEHDGEQRILEADYSAALTRYNEGLRGAALVSALGALVAEQ